mgnify:FL=1
MSLISFIKFNLSKFKKKICKNATQKLEKYIKLLSNIKFAKTEFIFSNIILNVKISINYDNFEKLIFNENMKGLHFSSIIIILSLISCSSPTGKSMKENGYDKDDDILLLKHGGNDSSELSDTDMSYDYFEEPIIQSYTQNSDTLVISEDCVIFFWPDSLEIEDLKIKNPNSYSEILEEMISLASEVAISLDAANIKNFFCDKEILLIKNIDSQEIIKRKKVDFNMVIFKYGTQPVFCNTFDYNKDSCANIFNKPSEIIELDTIQEQLFNKDIEHD